MTPPTAPTPATPATQSPPATTLTARSPEDLLAAAAVVLGFWPSESVVMLTFDATHPFHARVDLPDDLAAMPELASVLVAPAALHEVGRVVLLLYSAHPERTDTARRALVPAFAAHGIHVVETLHVGTDHWRSLPDGAAVPFERDGLAAHPFLAEAVVAGRVLHHSRADLAATLEPDADAVDRVTALAADLPTRDPEALAPVACQLAEGAWVHDLVSRHLSADLPGPRLDDREVARLLCAVQCLRVRDAAWSALTRARARSAVVLLSDVLRRAPADLRAAPAALLAWAAWQAGDGALAWCALERCDTADPTYGLAALIAEALERAVPPSVMADGFDWKEGLDGVDRD